MTDDVVEDRLIYRLYDETEGYARFRSLRKLII